MTSPAPATKLCRYTNERIFLRELDLVRDVIGKVGFTDLFFHQLMGRLPSPAESRMLDAVLVTLMEHGLTPSVIATRMVAISSPEALQASVASGLLAVGSQFIGTIEDSARLLAEIVAAPEGIEARAKEVAETYTRERRPLPGFGHHLHRPDDPRSPRLLALADEIGLSGPHVRALRALAAAVDEARGRHLTINATGAVGAVLAEMDVPVAVIRGIAVVSRAAGLVAHVLEEQHAPAGRFIWDLAEEHVVHEAGSGEK